MNDYNELISVIMPVYNGGKYLRDSIESVLNQTYKNFEFIIIDDDSDDETESIVNEYKDKRIKYYKQSRCGVTISLNKGIGISKGKFIARQDADDVSMPDRLEKQYNFMKKNENLCLLGTFSKLIDSCGNEFKDATFKTSNKELKNELKHINPFIHGSVMIRKKFLKEVGLYREQFFMCQSYDLWLRISEKFEIAIIPEFLYSFRIWPESTTNKRMGLNNYMKSIAKDLALERFSEKTDLLQNNNYSFYEKYSKDMVEAYSVKTKHYFLVGDE